MSLSSLIAMNKTIFFLSFLIGGEMIQDECDDICCLEETAFHFIGQVWFPDDRKPVDSKSMPSLAVV